MEATRKLPSRPSGASPLRVLLVEDNDSDAMVAQAAVEKALRGPCEVLRAATLANGLAIVESGSVDLVLLDLNLPDSRGVNTLKRMRVATTCPIIVVTVEDRPGLDEEALGNGAFEILHKGRLGHDAIVRLLRLAEDQRRVQGSLEDAKKALDRTHTRLELAIAASGVCTWDYDLPSGKVVLSESWAEMIGAPPGETRTTSKSLGELVHPDDFASFRQKLIDMMKGLGSSDCVEHRNRHRSGEWRWISWHGKVIERDAHGRAVRMVGTNLDITERKLAEAQLAQLAQFDAVTGLPNRGLLEAQIEQAIAQARRRSRGAGVLFINLDRFKLVNDTFGHVVGDELLAQVGQRLKRSVRREDSVARISADEFAVLVADLSRVEDAALVARKIVDSFSVPFLLRGHETFVTVSVGMAAYPNDGDSPTMLLERADTAMNRAKESPGNAFLFFASDMNLRAASKLQLHTDLRHAVDRGEFRLHYQPKVLLDSGAITGVEALLRWQHPARGLVQPMEFIPALEDTGLIVQVGDWVIEEASNQLRKWALEGLAAVPIAVNLSAKQFRRRDLDKVIRRLLGDYGISPELIELEITESCLMDDPKDAVRQLHALRDSGLKISVDDFGTGYSSLSYLTRLPLSTLKIDRSFVNAATTDPSSAVIVKMVIDMAQNLRFSVVAEGIESDQHVAFLRRHGCEQGQGYHFGRPVTAEAIAPRLARQ